MSKIPQVGDRRMESFIRRGNYKNSEASQLEPCVVTEIHHAHLDDPWAVRIAQYLLSIAREIQCAL